MKPLIAIFSCYQDCINGRNQAIRDTWGRSALKYFDLKFFIGNGAETLSEDVVHLDVYDGGDNLVYKEAAMIGWAVNQGYERILKTETDVYMSCRKLFEYDYAAHDVIGAGVGTIGEIYGNTNRRSFIQGHATWYSRKAAQFIADELISNTEELMPTSTGSHMNHSLRSSDMWSGQVLYNHWVKGEITISSDLANYGYGPLTWHCPGDIKGKVPDWLKIMHDKFGE